MSDTESKPPSISVRRVWLLGTFALAMCAAVALITPLDGINQYTGHDYNEGWNAYFSDRAWGEGDLYPQADELLINNYPPLSFFLIGGIGRLTGDQILAGRWISLIALFLIAGSLLWIVAKETQEPVLGAFTAVLFFALFTAHFPAYVAMCDPQIAAHLLAMLGLLSLLYVRHRHTSVVLAAAFLLAAGFTKHNLLPLPLAVTVWLLIHDRRRLWVWLASSAILLVAAGAVSYYAFGDEFLRNVFGHARVFGVSLVAKHTREWVAPLSLLIVIPAVAIVAGDRRPTFMLGLLYLASSLFFGCLSSGGEGVAYNAFFDFLIAGCLASGLALGRLGRSILPLPGWKLNVAVIGALALPLLIGLPASVVSTVRRHATLQKEAAFSRETIAFMAETAGPVMSESLALVYWAGKSIEVDWFNIGQAMVVDPMQEKPLVDLIERRVYAVIYTDDKAGRTQRLPVAINAAISRNYQIARVGPMLGALLVPKDDSITTGTRPEVDSD